MSNFYQAPVNVISKRSDPRTENESPHVGPTMVKCVREEPEYRGYAAPSIGVLLGVCLVGGTAIFCGMASISIAREYANQSASSRSSGAPSYDLLPRRDHHGDAHYMTLSGDPRGAGVRGDPTEDAEVAMVTKKGAVGRPVGAGRVRRGRRGVRARTGLPEPSPLARKILTVTRIVCGTGIAAVLVMCAAVVAFAPHTPGVNVCNTEFDWVSFASGWRTFALVSGMSLGRRPARDGGEAGGWRRETGDGSRTDLYSDSALLRPTEGRWTKLLAQELLPRVDGNQESVDVGLPGERCRVWGSRSAEPGLKFAARWSCCIERH